MCLRIQLACLRTEGIITYKGIGATVEEEIALIINERQDIVEKALGWLVSMGWATRLQNGYEVNYLEYGSESASAERQRRRRERLKLEIDTSNIQKALQCNDTTRDIVTTEEITEDIDRGQQQQQENVVVAELCEEEKAAMDILTAEPWNITIGRATELVKTHGAERCRVFARKLRTQAQRGEVGAGLLIRLVENPDEPTPVARSQEKREQKIERFIGDQGEERIRLV